MQSERVEAHGAEGFLLVSGKEEGDGLETTVGMATGASAPMELSLPTVLRWCANSVCTCTVSRGVG